MSDTRTSTAEPAALAASDVPVRPARRRTVAVVWPHDLESLRGALDARTTCDVEPLLVGDPTTIAALLARLEVAEPPRVLAAASDIDAAVLAVALVRAHEADILMKGHLHTDDFLRPILHKTLGLLDGRQLSHVFACAMPAAAYHKTLFVTDAAFNIAPGLAQKRAIVQNAIDFVRALGVVRPKVALLAAVESVNPAMAATLDAAALCKMAERGQITGAILDGPLAFDNALSAACAQSKGIDSPVAGDPDILLAPEIETGNVMYKQFVHFSGALAAGIVLGASAPVLLTSRTEPAAARSAAIALATHVLAAA